VGDAGALLAPLGSGHENPSHRIGSKIPIAYDPDDPTTVRWRPFYGSTLPATWGCLASGVVRVAGGIGFLISAVTS
jgi:hypothetical protein